MRIAKKFYIATASIVVAVSALVALNVTGTSTQAMSSARNCNADAVIKCGAISQDELLEKYDQNVGDVKSVYSHYGISRSTIAGTNGEIKVGTVYQDGRVVVDGETVATGAHSVSRIRYTSAGEPETVKINSTTYYEGPSMQIFTGPVDAFVIFKDGQFYKAVLSSCGNPIIAVPVKPEVKPKPVFACKNLTATEIDRTRYRFTATASAQDGAEIVGYVFTFGDGVSKTSTSNTIEHTYSQAGTYTARVAAKIAVGNKTQTTTEEDCETTVVIEEKPETPLYRCDNLTAQLIQSSDHTYEYTLTHTAQGGATLDHVVYNYGDNTSETVSGTNADTVQHTYTTSGTFTTTATLYFNVNHGSDSETAEKSDSCQVAITIQKQDNCTLPGKEHLPANSAECVEKCVIPGKEHLDKNSTECVETPPELPKTGLEMFIGGTLGVGSITAAGYYWSASRKNLLDTFLKR